MPTPISLCVIAGQEESHAERFLDSFKDCFDELCLVRAIGNQIPDQTKEVCEGWCQRHGKVFNFGVYHNAGSTGRILETPVHDHRPETWKHVDDFAAARNMAWKMASHQWQLWADFDDILVNQQEAAGRIRLCADVGKYDIVCFTYDILTSQQHNLRERLFRTGLATWKNPVHETCWHEGQVQISYDKDVVFSHEPGQGKVRDERRNWRIASYHVRFLQAYCHTLHQEAYYRWAHKKLPADAEEATHWAEISQHCDLAAELRHEILLNQADIAADKGDLDMALELCWSAVRLMPYRRDAWGALCEYELRGKSPRRASIMADIMATFRKPVESGYPSSDKYHSWQGLTLQCRAIRACANYYYDNGDPKSGDVQEARVRNLEKQAHEKFGKKFSVLHATRGRPQEALKTRHRMLATALEPMSIEYIFAIDADDMESRDQLREYRHVIVQEPNGCVKAWNLAASVSEGQVMVQMSDDWMPCMQWDGLMWLMLDEAAKGKLGIRKTDTLMPGTLGTVPLVLAISDGHREDPLLCMAILTRGRYLQQASQLFGPEYFGVYSDNEFSYRAYRDAVVVQARHITMRHDHPTFAGKPFSEWDATHQRQNDAQRYVEGKAVFLRRNPEPQAAQWAP